MRDRARETTAKQWRKLLVLMSNRARPAPPPPLEAPPMDEAFARWQTILDGTYGPSLVLDRDDIVIGSNAMADAILPNSRGQPFSAICRAPELLKAIATARDTAAQQPCHISRLSAYHGAAIAIVTPLTASPRPRHAALLIAIRDLTEQEKLSRMRSDFVANASHELRTPLTSLRGFIETLQGPAKDDPAARDRFLAIMHEQATRMSRLIDDLLSLSRVEMQEHLVPQGRISLADLVADAVGDAATAAVAADIAVVAPEAEQDCIVVGDRDELRLLLQNLVQNGIKYGRKGGRVTLQLTNDGKRGCIAITDTGIGISAEHLPRLTERFYRVDTQESRTRGGTGLGLAIVKHIVSRHRGELLITSEVGVGSTFTVKLPLAR